jgi:hypothetical protein
LTEQDRWDEEHAPDGGVVDAVLYIQYRQRKNNRLKYRQLKMLVKRYPGPLTIHGMEWDGEGSLGDAVVDSAAAVSAAEPVQVDGDEGRYRPGGKHGLPSLRAL